VGNARLSNGWKKRWSSCLTGVTERWVGVCVRWDECFVQCRYGSLVPWKALVLRMLGVPEVDVGTQAKVVMLEGQQQRAALKQSSMQSR